MTTTIDLPADLFREIERRAASRGQDLAETLAELLRLGLEASELPAESPRPAIKVHPKTGLPYVECRHAAADMTPQRVADILLAQEARAPSWQR